MWMVHLIQVLEALVPGKHKVVWVRVMGSQVVVHLVLVSLVLLSLLMVW